MPEWYLAIAVMGLLSAAGAFWAPLLLALPLLGAAVAALLIDAGLGAARARFPDRRGRSRRRMLTAFLYLAQPLVRLEGRIVHGLTPWRRRGPRSLGLPRPRTYALWSETWLSTEERVRAVCASLRAAGSVVRSGGDWDRWDLESRGGMLGGARLRLAIEEHGAGRQLMRVRSWPHVSRVAVTLGAFVSILAALALLSGADAVAAALGLLAVILVLRLAFECGAATVTIRKALDRASVDETMTGPEASLATQPPRIGIVLD
jgi:hypothetical protein